MVFYNNVADRLTRRAPQSKAKIGFLIYSNITLPPVKDVDGGQAAGRLPRPDRLRPDPRHGRPPLGAPARVPGHPVQVGQGHAGPAGDLRLRPEHAGLARPAQPVAPGLPPGREALPQGRHPGHRHREPRRHGHDLPEPVLPRATAVGPGRRRGRAAGGVLPEVLRPGRRADGATTGPRSSRRGRTRSSPSTSTSSPPPIYTPELVDAAAQASGGRRGGGPPAASRPRPGPTSKRTLDRVRFTRLGFDVLDAYMAMVHAADTEVDYNGRRRRGRARPGRPREAHRHERHVHHLQARSARAATPGGPAKCSSTRNCCPSPTARKGAARRQAAAGVDIPPRPEGRRRQGRLGEAAPDLDLVERPEERRPGPPALAAPPGQPRPLGAASDRPVPAGPGPDHARLPKLHRPRLVPDAARPHRRASPAASSTSASPACSTNAGCTSTASRSPTASSKASGG